jgi:hypothetical protein
VGELFAHRTGRVDSDSVAVDSYAIADWVLVVWWKLNLKGMAHRATGHPENFHASSGS